MTTSAQPTIPTIPPPRRAPPPVVATPAPPVASKRPAGALKSIVTRGIVREEPLILAVYGVDGVGKSTLAASAPSPIFLGAEKGTEELDVDRLPPPKTWTDALEYVEALRLEEHEYRTLAVDTVDWLEPLCAAHVAAEAGKASIDDIGYGKGYPALRAEWRKLLERLSRLHEERKMHLVLLGHSTLRKFKNPNGPDWDRYTLKLDEGAAAMTREWAKAVLFANYDRVSAQDADTKKVTGYDSGKRLLWTRSSAGHDAKNRYLLPETVALSWRALSDEIRVGLDLRTRLAEAMRGAAPEAREAAQRHIEAASWSRESFMQVIDGLMKGNEVSK